VNECLEFRGHKDQRMIKGCRRR